MISSCMWLPLASCLEDHVFLIGPRCLLMERSSLHVICTSGLVVPALTEQQDKVRCMSHHKEEKASCECRKLIHSRHTQCLWCLAPMSIG